MSGLWALNGWHRSEVHGASQWPVIGLQLALADVGISPGRNAAVRPNRSENTRRCAASDRDSLWRWWTQLSGEIDLAILMTHLMTCPRVPETFESPAVRAAPCCHGGKPGTGAMKSRGVTRFGRGSPGLLQTLE